MLVSMSTNPAGDAAAPAGALETLVGSSEAPLAAVELPSGRFLAVNPPLAKVLGTTADELAGSSSLDQLSPDERHAGQLGFQALAEGDLTGYQAIRRLPQAGEPDQVFSVWVTVTDLAGARVGLVTAIPAADHVNQPGVPPPLSKVPEQGNVVLGTVDGSWRIDRISQDVTPLLGVRPEECSGRPVLGVIHPADAPAFLAAVEHARRGQRAVRLSLRLSPGAQNWTVVAAIIATISPGNPPPLAFALVRDEADPEVPAGSNREKQLEAHMLRIAEELRTAGLIPRLERLPALTEVPQLGGLTSREWAVLTRLMDGQRASAIASDLFVSNSTVRNHLSSIYAKLGVNGQVDLIRVMGQRTKRPAEDDPGEPRAGGTS
jgi:DNA-binding CsgD family transcriptional regulator